MQFLFSSKHFTTLYHTGKKAIALACCCLFPLILWGQSEIDSSLVKEESKVNIKYREPLKLKPIGGRLGLDIFPLIFSAFEPDFSGFTAHAALNLSDRYWINLDIGTIDANRTKNSSPFYSNQTQGSFFRLGIDYNFSYWSIPSGAALCIGMHYGQSSFSNTIINPSLNPTWGNTIEIIENSKLRSSWLEPRFTLQTKVFKSFSMAAMLGVRVRASLSSYSAFPNEIPGFGLTKSRARLSFGYRVCYEFGGKKVKSIPKKMIDEVIK